jgi:hypothetical protein
VLLNILVALFNQAYSVITDNAVDEFLALFSHKTLNFIRAPDENTFCPPLNLIEVFLLVPLEPFLKKSTYQRLNEVVMKVVYSPVLVLIAVYESKYLPESIDSRFQARKITANRMVGLQDGEERMGWDVDAEFDAEQNGWAERVRSTIPRIEEDEMVLLRRVEKKLDSVEVTPGVASVDADEIQGRRGGGPGQGTEQGDVANETEERWYTGPNETDKGKGKAPGD